MQDQGRDYKIKIQALEYQIALLKNELEESNTKVDKRITEIEKERQEFIQQELEKTQEKIQQLEERDGEERNQLKEHIKVLQIEGNKRTDEFLRMGVEMDDIKEKLAISQENEANLNNSNDCLKEIIDVMQGILHKHGEDNQALAEQLVAYRQYIIESSSFNSDNKKFKGIRHGAIYKSESALYFTEEYKDHDKVEKDYFLIMEYGSVSAVKINLRDLKEFYLIDGTNKIWFSWPDKKWYKSQRKEIFEWEDPEAVKARYLEIIDKMEDLITDFDILDDE